MAKGIIVVNATERCNQCKFWFAKSTMPIKYMCMAGQKEITEKNLNENKPDWCPIKPIPKKDTREYMSRELNFLKKGWNDCIDEIIKK